MPDKEIPPNFAEASFKAAIKASSSQLLFIKLFAYHSFSAMAHKAPLLSRRARVHKGENSMGTTLQLASVLVFVAGLSAATAQQAPTENKGVKTEPLSGFGLGKQGLD